MDERLGNVMVEVITVPDMACSFVLALSEGDLSISFSNVVGVTCRTGRKGGKGRILITLELFELDGKVEGNLAEANMMKEVCSVLLAKLYRLRQAVSLNVGFALSTEVMGRMKEVLNEGDLYLITYSVGKFTG